MNDLKPTNKVQKFLLKKFENNKPLKQDFIKVAGVVKSTVSNIINGKHPNPDILTLIKISLYFKISLDELFKRPKNYISSEEEQFNNKLLISINLKNFLTEKLDKEKLDPSILGLTLGFSGNPIYTFLKENSEQKIFRSDLIIALADYFKVPIYKMLIKIET